MNKNICTVFLWSHSLLALICMFLALSISDSILALLAVLMNLIMAVYWKLEISLSYITDACKGE